MPIRWMTIALLAFFSAPAWADDLAVELTDCRAFEVERAALMAAGIAADMEKGPEWASANLPPSRLQQIKKFIHVDEKLTFHCPEVFATAAVKAEEERARQQAREAQLWEEKLAQFAKDPLLPEPKPTELARAKPRTKSGPPLPERATR